MSAGSAAKNDKVSNGHFIAHVAEIKQAIKEAMTEHNAPIVDELKEMRTQLVGQLEKMIDNNLGHVPDGMIPLSTYKEHLDANKDLFKWQLKIIVLAILALAGIFKLAPPLLELMHIKM